MHKRLIVIVGPTSSGKSELAVIVAKKFNGEVISADSRQVYAGMDLGTGKVAGQWQKKKTAGRNTRRYVYKTIPHHCIDIVSPRSRFSVTRFQKLAQAAIADIHRRGKLPILCGGTGHWIDAVVFDQAIPNVKPNAKLRTKLEKKSVPELYEELRKLDPRRAQAIDPKNKRRLIRALEIVLSTGKPVPASAPGLPHYHTLWLGVRLPQSKLYEKIDHRLQQRLRQGMVAEIKKLRRQGISWQRLESFGLEYKFISLHLQGRLSYDEMVNQLFTAIRQYSKRQLTWWKRNHEIIWLSPSPARFLRLAKTFLSK